MTGERTAATESAQRIAREIVEKRVRQQVHHGFWAEHDDRYQFGELPMAAATYAVVAARPSMRTHYRKTLWPWPDHWLRDGAPRELLINAAALIIAEIERLERMAPANSSEGRP